MRKTGTESRFLGPGDTVHVESVVIPTNMGVSAVQPFSEAGPSHQKHVLTFGPRYLFSLSASGLGQENRSGLMFRLVNVALLSARDSRSCSS